MSQQNQTKAQPTFESAAPAATKVTATVTRSSKEKAPSAFRTISEVADELAVPQHVLRFWETKFTQIKPLKRNGGRRFYRPQDIDVLQQIKHLLYNQGYTIKGAKKAVDDFIHARSDNAVSASEWMANVPPASVNDNVTDAPLLFADVIEEPTSDILADIAQALAEPVVEASSPSRDQLSAMRAELVALRDGLRVLLPAASPLVQ